jgi:competence ComEA-like helix-hairpin-helix protein
MFNFSPSQRTALIFLSCLLAFLLVTAGFLRLISGGRSFHVLFIQPTPMQIPSAHTASTSPSYSGTLTPSAPFTPPPPTVLTRSPATINVNVASESELQSLPEIGPALASRIARYREKHGAFHTADDLLKVKGIGPKTLGKIRPYVTCG